MKKLFAMLLLAVVVISFSFAQEKVTVWGWRPQDVPLWQKVERILQSRGVKVSIDYQPFLSSEYFSKLYATLQGGSGPDIMYTGRLPKFPAFRSEIEQKYQASYPLIEGNFLLPLDGKVDFSNFPDSTMNLIRQNGTTWGVPFANQIVGIFYNTEIFEKYNLKEPSTWDELLALCDKLLKNKVTPFYVSGKDAWTLAMQNAIVSVSYPGEDWIAKLLNGETRFTDPQYVEMLTALNDLKKYYQKDFSANSLAELDMAFPMGQAAMVFDGIFGSANWLQSNPDFKFGFFPAPPKVKGVNPKVYVYMDGSLAIYAKSKHQAAALEVLKFTATPEFGKLFSEETGEMTAVKGVTMPADKPVLVECYKAAMSIASKSIYWTGGPFDMGKPTVYTILSPNMQAMYLGMLSPADFAAKIQDGVGIWYPPFKK